MQKTYTLTADVWLYPGMAAWHFITLPVRTADEIKFLFNEEKRGWGSLRVTVTMGKTTWKTSIFPDKKTNSYLLPLKADVRKKEAINAGDTVKFDLTVEG